MMEPQQFCLKWDSHQGSVTALFDSLRRDGELVDVTLCCEGQQLRAHRMVLSACSPYFRELLKSHPCQQLVFFLKDTSATDLSAVIEFMYRGRVNVSQTQLASFIRTAEMLQIRGLSGDQDKSPDSPEAGPPRSPPPPSKRRRTSGGPSERPPPPSPPPRPPARPEPAAAAASPLPPANHAPPPPPPPPPPPGPAAGESIKVEKVDLTEEEEGLDATLGYVAELEGGGYGEQADMAAELVETHAVPGGGSPAAGPSQRLSAPEDSASGAPARSVCNICGSSYKHRESLYHHKKKHLGLTKCPVCSKVCSIVADLRRHMEVAHQLSSEEVRRIIPTKPKDRISWSQFMAGQ